MLSTRGLHSSRVNLDASLLSLAHMLLMEDSDLMFVAMRRTYKQNRRVKARRQTSSTQVHE